MLVKTKNRTIPLVEVLKLMNINTQVEDEDLASCSWAERLWQSIPTIVVRYCLTQGKREIH